MKDSIWREIRKGILFGICVAVYLVILFYFADAADEVWKP